MTPDRDDSSTSQAERLCRLAVRALAVITVVALALFVLQVAGHPR